MGGVKLNTGYNTGRLGREEGGGGGGGKTQHSL